MTKIASRGPALKLEVLILVFLRRLTTARIFEADGSTLPLTSLRAATISSRYHATTSRSSVAIGKSFDKPVGTPPKAGAAQYYQEMVADEFSKDSNAAFIVTGDYNFVQNFALRYLIEKIEEWTGRLKTSKRGQ